MARPRKSVPTYRLHKQSGQAVVTLSDPLVNRRDVLLGRHGSAESRAEYARVIGEWEASARRLPGRCAEPSAPDITVNEVAAAYWRHVESYYVKDGQHTSEQHAVRQALRYVKPLCGHTLARDFGPLALKAVRQKFIDHPVKRKIKAVDPDTGAVRREERVLRQGLARRNINKLLARIKRMFAWAVAEELLPAAVHEALLRVDGLRKGKGQGREMPASSPWLLPGSMPCCPTCRRSSGRWWTCSA
jgi:hypothetical protein